MTDGTRANRSGRRLEEFVRDSLDERGYQEVPKQRFYPMQELAQPIFAAQIEIGLDIYGRKRRVDFALYHPQLWPDGLAIQCKWQASRGSVEEKYPFEVLSVAISPLDTIIVLDGRGYSAGAKQWLLGKAGKNQLLHVLDLGEFQRFVSQGRI